MQSPAASAAMMAPTSADAEFLAFMAAAGHTPYGAAPTGTPVPSMAPLSTSMSTPLSTPLIPAHFSDLAMFQTPMLSAIPGIPSASQSSFGGMALASEDAVAAAAAGAVGHAGFMLDRTSGMFMSPAVPPAHTPDWMTRELMQSPMMELSDVLAMPRAATAGPVMVHASPHEAHGAPGIGSALDFVASFDLLTGHPTPTSTPTPMPMSMPTPMPTPMLANHPSDKVDTLGRNGSVHGDAPELSQSAFMQTPEMLHAPPPPLTIRAAQAALDAQKRGAASRSQTPLGTGGSTGLLEPFPMHSRLASLIDFAAQQSLGLDSPSTTTSSPRVPGIPSLGPPRPASAAPSLASSMSGMDTPVGSPFGSSTPSFDLTTPQGRKKYVRMMRNREAADASRKRRRQHLAQLEQETQQLIECNTGLKSRVKDLLAALGEVEAVVVAEEALRTTKVPESTQPVFVITDGPMWS
ncbi:hypothetical protein CXG81DRAFT_19199 [Caulochytrium protostelioides]|uniref:BZIP domain-containing protein n=1 Tax=Caulochytrium protostelioides TaxID=1555241 RepID=A0A4P9X6T9_9FUNG|nr:hypothetical protein CXG81DRAFT_19199 [Caulochytrium protostelioides]|eukprot:RKP00926.1 hypothetical protein CXG81DRAFT_19199 [Caulochytrium protostelioides]